MPTLASLARVTRRGGTITPDNIDIQRDDVQDSTETKCWLIYTAMKEAAERSASAEIDSLGRVVYLDNLKRHARDLYPTVQWSDPTVVANFMKPIYSYLRASGNATIIQRNVGGDTNITKWSLAPEWTSGNASAPVKQIRTPRKSEAKVTAAEAGEDREPAPVIVTRKEIPVTDTNAVFPQVEGGYGCPLCPSTFATLPKIRGHYGAAHKQDHIKKSKAYRATKVVEPKASPKGSVTRDTAIRTGDPERPWGCPICDATFTNFHGVGGHLSKHNAEAREAEIAALRAEVAALRAGQPIPAVNVTYSTNANSATLTGPQMDVQAALDVLVDYVTTPQSSVDTGALAQAEAEISLLTGKIEKMSKQISALLAVE